MSESEKKNGKGHKKHHIISEILSDEDIALESLDKKLEKELDATREANNRYVKDPEYHGRSKLELRAREIAFALLAVVIGSLSTVSIMIPNNLTVGGVTGAARIIQFYTNWDYSIVYLAISGVIVLFVWGLLGFKEVKKIVLMSIAYPIVMFVLERFDIVLMKSDDLFLVSVVVGVFYGISNGLTFKAGFSSGGADSVAKILKFRFLPHLGINDLVFMINAVIVIISAFVFGANIAMYAIVIIFISMRVGEAVMYGYSNKIVELNIISEEPDELSDYIMNDLGRGVTSIGITGEYTGEKKKQIKIICSPRESFIIKRYLAKHDPKAFVSVTSVKSVWGAGKGFSNIRDIEM